MKSFSLRDRLKSFVHAIKGIQLLIKFEHNAWIHVFALIVVVLIGFWLGISRPEWIFIVLAISIVFIAEGLNTAIEKLADAITTAHNEHIKKAKDISAGAVLIAAITAVVMGLLVFTPHIIEKFK